MSTILGNPITLGGGGAKLNIDYGSTPPTDTTKLWVPLEKKPDGVECSPVLNYGGNTIETLQAKLPDAQKFSPAVIARGNYLYVCGGGSTSSYSNATNKITKINTKTGVSTELSVKLPQAKIRSIYVEVNNKLYIFGGVGNQSLSATSNVYVFDPSTETIETRTNLTINVSTNAYGCQTGVAVGNKVYFIGFLAPSYIFGIYTYDVDTQVLTYMNKQAPSAVPSCAYVNGTIYCFGGDQTSSNQYKNWYKIDPKTGNVTNGGNFLYSYCACAAIGKYIYLFTGFYAGYYNTIMKFDTETDTFETLSVTTSEKISSRELCKSAFDVYVMGGFNPSQTRYNINIDKFSVSSPLTKNRLFLQEDYGYDFLWSAIKSKDADLKVKVINAYLGDSNNIAQHTNAYLYDTTTNQWKSLSGESYVADMQNALNIMGVN